MSLNAQKTDEAITKDSKPNLYPQKYGLRIGADMASLIRTIVSDEYRGFQILADYRLTRNLYVAGELGYEDINKTSDRIDFKTNGSFFKGGLDYNLYDNWLDMDNMIYFGTRIGAANMSQTLNRFEFNNDNNFFPIGEQLVDMTSTNLKALWVEFQLGTRVEVLTNLFIVLNVQLRRMITESTPENFDNLFVPGYGRTYDTGEIGVGYSYGITYRIPFYKN